MKEKKLNELVYNASGEYGANQRSPHLMKTANPDEYHQLCVIVKSHFPNMSQEEIDVYLWKLRQEGCAYVAMVNSLFDEFSDKPDLFRKIFGFSMFRHDKTLNFNQILVDLYCKTDNHNGYSFLFFDWDYYAENEDRIWDDPDKDGKYQWIDKPYGNNEEQIKYRFKKYCKSYGIDVKLVSYHLITPKTYHIYAADGTVSILCSNFTLTNDKNQTSHVKNGHYMVITGALMEENKFIVSSWGEKYYLNPKDIKGFEFYQMVKYRKIKE